MFWAKAQTGWDEIQSARQGSRKTMSNFISDVATRWCTGW